MGNVVHEYILSGSTVIAEKWTENNLEHMLVYVYDDDGSPMAIQYRNTRYLEGEYDVFFFEKNMFGDVIGIYNEDGVKIGGYVYDTWGNFQTTGSQWNTALENKIVSTYNPFRYRGYFYDVDLGFYYLQSRYYSSEIGRFISADGAISAVGGELRGYNQFAYCFNNPVNMTDASGNWPGWAKKLVAAAAVVAVVAAVAAVTVATAGAGTAAAVVAVGAAKGAAIGLAAGAATGAVSGAISHRVSTGSWDGWEDATLNGMADGALSGAITGAVVGGVNSGIQVAQAAKSWNSGTFKSGFQSMNHHYKNKVLGQGYGKGNNVVKYTQDALDFANNNSSHFKYQYSAKYGHSRWFYSNSSGGGYFSGNGNIYTFWYKG